MFYERIDLHVDDSIISVATFYVTMIDVQVDVGFSLCEIVHRFVDFYGNF